jgi:alkanesulfonate monooxygenase SsuD/methylene tetrahydromethanopterin reductase-like flavin-dependent oxidoreductase (luciferase family)
LAIAARLGDACNLPSGVDVLTHKLEVLDRHLAAAGRTRDDVAVTVLDLPVVGRDRDDAWARVERLRGRAPAAAYARRTHAGTVAQHRARYAELHALGVSTVFVGVRGLEGPDEVRALAGLNS